MRSFFFLVRRGRYSLEKEDPSLSADFFFEGIIKRISFLLPSVIDNACHPLFFSLFPPCGWPSLSSAKSIVLFTHGNTPSSPFFPR